MAPRRPAVTAHALVGEELAHLRFVKHARRADAAAALQAASKAIVTNWKSGSARVLGLAAGACGDPLEVAAAAREVAPSGVRLTFDVARSGAVTVMGERTREGVTVGPETHPVLLARAEAFVVVHILEHGLQWRHWAPTLVEAAPEAVAVAL